MSLFRPYWLGLALLLAQIPLPAQIGGPGQYPPGQYPPGSVGGTGIPIPRRNKKKKDDKVPLQSTTGMLRRIQKEQVIVEADDHRILNFRRDDNTHFLKEGSPIKPTDLKPGDAVEVESSEDDEGFFTAVNVMWQQDGTAKDRAHAAEPVEVSLAKNSKERAKTPEQPDDPPSSAAAPPPPAQAAPPAAPAPTAAAAAPDDPSPADLTTPVKDDTKIVQIDPDDQGPPVLKRGGSATRKAAAPAPPSAEPSQELSARNEPPPEEARPTVTASMRPEEVIIEKARQASGSFLETLPNYFCQEVMTRYQSGSHNGGWQPLDVVSMALVYEKGQESYRNINVNGKATKKSIEDLGGAWSTGEFGSVLADLFSPATAADFEYRKESRSGGRASLVYDFNVEREHSHWRVMVASQLVLPSYRGSVWIDKATNRVLRIEMQATHMPEAFPTDKVEMATDYEFVRFDDREFLVPVHAETLGCERGTDNCTRNAIDFRNYHKYSGESTIIFEK